MSPTLAILILAAEKKCKKGESPARCDGHPLLRKRARKEAENPEPPFAKGGGSAEPVDSSLAYIFAFEYNVFEHSFCIVTAIILR